MQNYVLDLWNEWKHERGNWRKFGSALCLLILQFEDDEPEENQQFNSITDDFVDILCTVADECREDLQMLAAALYGLVTGASSLELVFSKHLRKVVDTALRCVHHESTSIKFLAVHCINNGLVSVDLQDEELVESIREANVLDDIMDKLLDMLDAALPCKLMLDCMHCIAACLHFFREEGVEECLDDLEPIMMDLLHGRDTLEFLEKEQEGESSQEGSAVMGAPSFSEDGENLPGCLPSPSSRDMLKSGAFYCMSLASTHLDIKKRVEVCQLVIDLDFEHVDDKHFNEGMWKGWLSFVETIPPEEFAPFVRPLISRVLRDVSRNPSVIVQDLAEDGTPLPSSLDEQQEDSNAFFVSRGPRSAGRSTTDEREKKFLNVEVHGMPKVMEFFKDEESRQALSMSMLSTFLSSGHSLPQELIPRMRDAFHVCRKSPSDVVLTELLLSSETFLPGLAACLSDAPEDAVAELLAHFLVDLLHALDKGLVDGSRSLCAQALAMGVEKIPSRLLAHRVFTRVEAPLFQTMFFGLPESLGLRGGGPKEDFESSEACIHAMNLILERLVLQSDVFGSYFVMEDSRSRILAFLTAGVQNVLVVRLAAMTLCELLEKQSHLLHALRLGEQQIMGSRFLQLASLFPPATMQVSAYSLGIIAAHLPAALEGSYAECWHTLMELSTRPAEGLFSTPAFLTVITNGFSSLYMLAKSPEVRTELELGSENEAVELCLKMLPIPGTDKVEKVRICYHMAQHVEGSSVPCVLSPSLAPKVLREILTVVNSVLGPDGGESEDSSSEDEQQPLWQRTTTLVNFWPTLLAAIHKLRDVSQECHTIAAELTNDKPQTLDFLSGNLPRLEEE